MADQDGRSRLDVELEQLRVALERLYAAVHAAGGELETEALQQRLGSGATTGAAETKVAAIRTLVGRVRGEIVKLRARIDDAEHEASDQRVRRADAAARLKIAEERLAAIERSPVWKTAKPLWKIFRRKTKSADIAASDLAFGIDTPAEWTTGRDILLIRGWCHSLGGRELAGVRVKIGRKSRFARYGLARRDVLQENPHLPAAARSGFTVEIRVPRGKSMIQLEAIEQGGTWQRFFEHELIGEGIARDDEAEPQREQQRLPRLAEIRANRALDLLIPKFREHHEQVGNAAPTFSVITPTFNTTPKWFTEAALTLFDQTFADWEWCVVDDGSTNRDTTNLLTGLSKVSPRLKIQSTANGGISAATNAALDAARGDYVCFFDHDDLLASNALSLFAAKFEEGFDAIYSDEDKLDDQTGELVEHFYKPDWSPEYFRGAMYVGHLLSVRRQLAQTVRFKSDFDGVQDFEFMLRVSEATANIGHVPQVLYHWRKTPGSIAEKGDAKTNIGELQSRAVNAQLERLKFAAEARPAVLPHRLEIVPKLTEFPPITIIIPTKDAPQLLGPCLASLEKSSYPDFEVLLIDNETTDPDALSLMEKHRVRRIPLPGRFNFSRANNIGAAQAGGDFLVFLNNDTEIISADWLEHLLYYAQQPDVGASGALLVYEDETVQHAGVVLGMRGTADHVMRGFPRDVDGYAGSLACAREVAAVTAACMMIRKSLFLEIGGFNEHFFTAYQDLDLCLRLRVGGLRIIYTPRAVVTHHESVSRQKYYDMVDRMLLLDQWESVIERGDPYYNAHLNLERGDYSFIES
jgi:GT2 family glycosyltransferase